MAIFKCGTDAIEVSSSFDKETTNATIMVNDEGKCCLRVNNKERLSWQFRKDALEKLFFGPDELF
jgi:hypothetical protein